MTVSNTCDSTASSKEPEQYHNILAKLASNELERPVLAVPPELHNKTLHYVLERDYFENLPKYLQVLIRSCTRSELLMLVQCIQHEIERKQEIAREVQAYRQRQEARLKLEQDHLKAKYPAWVLRHARCFNAQYIKDSILR